MKRLVLLASVLTAMFAAGSAAAQTAKLSVTVTGIGDVKGALMMALYDEAGYGPDTPVAPAMVPVTGKEVTYTFEGLKAGRYAVKMFHDVDGDGKMGTNPFGMPLEPFAFSNNAPANYGPATWAAASFDVGAGTTSHAIKLNPGG